MKPKTFIAKAKTLLNDYKQKEPATYAAAQQAAGSILILDGLIGIENPLGHKKRHGIFGALLGVVFGIVFMLAPTWFGDMSGISKMTASTTGTVVSVSNNSSDNTCAVTAKYTVGSTEYTRQSSSSGSSECGSSAGESIVVKYNPNQPASWSSSVTTVNNFLKLFTYMGVIIIISSLITFVIRLTSIIVGWKLLQDGRALAKTLPGSITIGNLIESLKKQFTEAVIT